MAGIGFELKKLFSHRGFLATMRAYGYAGIVCTGPIILGVLLLLGVTLIAEAAGLARGERELLMVMITYALIASSLLTSLFSMLITRCAADMLYMEQAEAVMPSFYGSLTVMLVIGAAGYGAFLHVSGIPLLYRLLSLLLFVTLVVVWTEIHYLTAIKDYRNILLAFFVSLLIALLIGSLLVFVLRWDAVAALLAGVCCGYGVMMVWYFALLYRYFPEGAGSMFSFLRGFDRFPQLALVGFFVTAGLFGHLIIMWASPLGVQVQGLYYSAAAYDIPALVAFFSILITTINFTTSVETRFYPQYRTYFSLFNDGGALGDIESAEGNMIRVLREELGYLAQKQLFSTLLFMVAGTLLLPRTALGFTAEMLGIYRVLCVGYALYAIGNSLMLIQLYFADNKGALFSAACFSVSTNACTLLFMRGPSMLFGFGLVLGGLFFCVAAWLRLTQYLGKLKYHVLSRQPVFAREETGPFTRLCVRLEARAARKRSAAEDKAEDPTAHG